MRNDNTTESTRPTMGEISHTHPETGATFGAVYRRGPVVADGGEDADAEPEREAADVDVDVDVDADSHADADADTGAVADATPTMKDVDHTPNDGTVRQIWDRGTNRTREEANR